MIAVNIEYYKLGGSMQSKIKFIHSGNNVSVIEFNEDQVKDVLGNSVYMLCYSQNDGFYLTYVKEKFELPEKLYGSTNQRSSRVLKAYNNSGKGVGVLCTGDKGSGKSLLMSKVCNDSGLPIILINSCYTGSQFELFINRLGNCVLFFDEFGKTYKRQDDVEPQESILSLLDGSTSNKRLVLLTENDPFLINEFILGRGGRVRYHFEYNKLEEDVITQYCQELECESAFSEDVIHFSRTSKSFSFDTLATLVKEHKEFGEKLEEFLPFINVDFRDKSRTEYILLDVINNSTGESILGKLDNKMYTTEYEPDELYVKFKNRDSRTDEDTCFDIIKHFISKKGDSFVFDNGELTASCIEHKTVPNKHNRAF